jgi:hypothetical protein
MAAIDLSSKRTTDSHTLVAGSIVAKEMESM